MTGQSIRPRGWELPLAIMVIIKILFNTKDILTRSPRRKCGFQWGPA